MNTLIITDMLSGQDFPISYDHEEDIIRVNNSEAFTNIEEIVDEFGGISHLVVTPINNYVISLIDYNRIKSWLPEL